VIVVKVETWKYGDPNQMELRGVICIANKGRVMPGVFPLDDDPDHCDYEVELQSPDGTKRRVRIDHWRRHGWVTLVAKALSALDRRR
jgi:hypothetical protein